jgi:hypothetical protein
MTRSADNPERVRRRAYRLVPWLVRALVPPSTPGTYVLFAGGHTTYTGRSDTDLQRRLVEHARALRGEFFDFDAHAHRRAAYLTECATFHAIDAGLENRIHPAAPAGSGDRCPFCRHVSSATIGERLQPEDFLQEIPDWRPITT